MIALQGPKIIPLATRMAPEVGALKRYRFVDKNLVFTTLTISRTGYTGEDGVEIILPAGAVGMGMKLLGGEMDPAKPDATIRPCGLGARDTLRIEAGMPLYGHELGEDIPATSCGVDFAISMDKDRDAQGEPFIGLPALRAIAEQGGPARRLVGIEIEGKRAARQGMAVRKGDSSAGVVSSGCFSPTLAKSIAMAFVDAAHSEPGTELSVDTGKGATLEARVVPLPFYKAGK
jgi:aminomethyltransferase